MANEVQIAGRGAVLIEVESTYNTDPTPSPSANAQIVRGFALADKEELVRVEGVSPHAAGFFAGAGPRSVGVKLSSFSYPTGIADANSRPREDAIMAILGFGTPTYAAGPPKTLTWKRLSQNHRSATLWHYTQDQSAGGNALLRKVTGLRGTGRIFHGVHEALQIEVTDAMGAGTSLADSASAPTVVLVDLQGDNRLALTSRSATVTTFAAGAASYSGRLRSLDITLNNNPQQLRGISTSGLPGAVILTPGTVEAKVQIEVVQVADWAPFTYRAAPTPINLALRYTAIGQGTSATTDTRDISLDGQIVDIEVSEGDGIQLWDLTIVGLFPDDGTAEGRTSADMLSIVDTST